MKLFSRILISILVLVLLAEVLLRLTYSRRLDYWSNFQYRPDTVVGYKYLPNSKGIFKNFAFSRPYSINSLGYPGPEYKVVKDSNTCRIIVVGTSDDTGLVTDGPENYVSLVNRLFKEHNQNVEVLNFSVDGEDRMLLNIDLIRKECLKFNPDVILLRNEFPLMEKFRIRDSYKGVVINYANPKTNIDSAKAFIDTAVLKRDYKKVALDHSFIYRGITKYIIDHQKDSEFMKGVTKFMYPDMKIIKAYLRTNMDWSIYKDKNKYKPVEMTEIESVKILKDLTTELAQRKITLLLFNTYHSSNNQHYTRLFSNNSINFFPVNVEMKDEHSFGELDGHSSQEGHKAIAMALYKKLQPYILAHQK